MVAKNGMGAESRILVTGGAGFIGINLVRRSLASGSEVLVMDALTYAANRNELGRLKSIHSNLAVAELNLTQSEDAADLVNEFRPTSVFHLAAESHVDQSIESPSNFLQSNVIGTYSLLEGIRSYSRSLPDAVRSEFRFVHVSTDEVFGDLGESSDTFSEASLYAPSSPYSASKASSDHLVRAWGRTYNLPYMISHCCNNFGPFQHEEKFIPTVIKRLISGQPIPIYGSGRQQREWIAVGDHVDALLSIADRGENGASYCVGSGVSLTNLQLVSNIQKLLIKQGLLENTALEDVIQHVEDRAGHDHCYRLDSSKIKTELGWSPKRAFDEALNETVSWYMDRFRNA